MTEHTPAGADSAIPDDAIEFAHRLFDGARAGDTAFVASAVDQGVPVDLTDEKGNDLRGMAQIIIAKHRKGATGDVLLTFRGEFTRFQDPQKQSAPIGDAPFGSEIIGSKMNTGDMPLPPDMMESAPFGSPADPAPF
jgi:hypothetical protein